MVYNIWNDCCVFQTLVMAACLICLIYQRSGRRKSCLPINLMNSLSHFVHKTPVHESAQNPLCQPPCWGWHRTVNGQIKDIFHCSEKDLENISSYVQLHPKSILILIPCNNNIKKGDGFKLDLEQSEGEGIDKVEILGRPRVLPKVESYFAFLRFSIIPGPCP